MRHGVLFFVDSKYVLDNGIPYKTDMLTRSLSPLLTAKLKARRPSKDWRGFHTLSGDYSISMYTCAKKNVDSHTNANGGM